MLVNKKRREKIYRIVIEKIEFEVKILYSKVNENFSKSRVSKIIIVKLIS